MTVRTPTGTPKTHEKKITRAQFIGLFSDTKWGAIRAHNNTKVKQRIDQILSEPVVDVGSTLVTTFIAALESNGIIDSTEAGIVLAGIPL